MAAADGDDSLYPIAVLIDELRNEDVQVLVVAMDTTQGLGEAARRLPGPQRPESGFPGTVTNERLFCMRKTFMRAFRGRSGLVAMIFIRESEGEGVG